MSDAFVGVPVNKIIILRKFTKTLYKFVRIWFPGGDVLKFITIHRYRCFKTVQFFQMLVYSVDLL